MSKYDLLIKRLVQSVSSLNNVEQVIIGLLKADKTAAAISIAKDMHPSREFASAFASGILLFDDYSFINFIEMKAIAGEAITAEEADAILEQYTGPDGRIQGYHRSVPKEILQSSSKKAMKKFFEWVLEDKTVGSIDYAKEYWQYLEKKI
jgi:hypothetical protein